jgi:hypothetical protein
MNLKKSYLTLPENPAGTLTEDDLARIGTYMRKVPDADELYTFPVVLCDNEIDRDLERFDTSSLETLAALFVGKTGLFDHSMQSRDQTARIYKAECVTDAARRTQTGEAYVCVRAMAYMPRIDKNRALIEEIDSGIKKEVSIGCAVSAVRCSVCGADVRRNPCGHRKGETYDGSVCHHVLSAPTDAYEWSFVAVPAQRAAGVTKHFKPKEEAMQDILKTIRQSDEALTLTPDQLCALRRSLDALESDALLGKAYRDDLEHETVRFGLAALPDLDGESLGGICKKLTAQELRTLAKSFEALADRRMPMKPQLRADAAPSEPDSAFKI